ncbi:hypothetical protein V8G54_008875 [Vigna mungo]|uniref:SHSP domain-containing protein n=1 Tax=Vigna mungo TaxID=3915 RepID=A0AAQ3P4X6_VIGMU
MSLDERTNPQAAAEPVHEDFIPPSDWDRQENSDTLILMLPGFKKEQLKVQVSSNRVLRLRGERKISDNKWRRFHKEVILSDSHDTTGINAKFEAGMLYIKLPKLIKPPTPTSPTTDDDHKPDATQQHDHEKDSKEDTTHEESKIEEQPRPVHEESQVMLQKEMSKAETEEKSEEMQETTQTRVKEQKEGHEDSEIKRDNDDEKEMREVVASKAEGSDVEGLSRISVGKMKTRLEEISEMVLEVKKQNKVANLVVLVFLVLLIGLYVKSVVKSYFAGPKNQDL